MTVGVSHTFGGTVVVVDLDNGKRWDLTPEMADAAAQKFTAAAGYMTASALVVVDCLESRQFRWAGNREDALKMASYLIDHAKHAREKLAEFDLIPDDYPPVPAA